MPSGAKKRKAAKRKNLKQPNGANPQGNNEVKSQDERESDNGELSSPASSQDHDNNHHPFNDGPEESGSTTNSVIVSDTNNAVQITLEATGNAQVGLKNQMDGEQKSEGNSDNISRTISSDVESRVCKKKQEEPNDSSVAGVELDKGFEVIERALAQNSAVHDVVQPTLTGDNDKRFPKSYDSLTEILTAKEMTSKENFGKVLRTVEEIVEKDQVVGSTKFGDGNKIMTLTGAGTDGPIDVKDTQALESYENQPLLGSSVQPPMTQKTSWLSCCGLFDVIASSNR